MVPQGLGMNEPTGLNNILGKVAERVKPTKSVMSSLQWLFPVVLPSCLVGMYLIPEYRDKFALLFFGLPAFYGLIYSYFAFTDPDRLHTEHHREAMTQMQRSYSDSTGAVRPPTEANSAPPAFTLPALAPNNPTLGLASENPS
jgi:hypothetical protein